MTKEVLEWTHRQLLHTWQKQEEKRRRLRVAIMFRGEDLGHPLPTATATLEVMSTANAVGKEEPTVTAMTDVATISTTPVHFETSTSAAPLMPSDAEPVMNPLIAANAIHSLSHHHDAPTSWQALVDHVRSSSMTSSLLSTQPLPALRVKKPLRFAELKEKQRSQARKGLLWRYALFDEERVEDRRHTKEEELTQMAHHTPITRGTLRAFLTNSGPMCRPGTSPSMSGTMDEK